mgnify:CR=1 FL=1
MSRTDLPRNPVVLICLALVAVCGVAWLHAAILAPFLASVALAFVLRPLVDGAERVGCPRVLGTSLALLGVMLAMLLVSWLLVPIANELLPMLRDRLPDLLTGLWMQVAPWLRKWGAHVPDTSAELKQELARQIQAHGAQWGAKLWQSALAGGSSVLSLAGLALLLPMLTFYWLLDWPRLAPKWQALVPQRWQPAWQSLIEEADGLMGQYLRGQLLVMGILALYYGLGLSLFGFSLGWPIGVLTGLAICIPYLGYGTEIGRAHV